MATSAPEDNFVPCSICSEPVDTTASGHGKLPAGDFCHSMCHKQGQPPESLDGTYDPVRPHVVHLYNCGHELYGPTRAVPLTCPECETPLVTVAGETEFEE